MRWLEHVGGRSVVVDHRNGQDLQSHHLSHISLYFIVFYSFLEFGDRVVVLVGELPPVRAQLRYVLDDLLLQLVNKLLELLVDLRQILQIELHLRVKLG